MVSSQFRQRFVNILMAFGLDFGRNLVQIHIWRYTDNILVVNLVYEVCKQRDSHFRSFNCYFPLLFLVHSFSSTISNLCSLEPFVNFVLWALLQRLLLHALVLVGYGSTDVVYWSVLVFIMGAFRLLVVIGLLCCTFQPPCYLHSHQQEV